MFFMLLFNYKLFSINYIKIYNLQKKIFFLKIMSKLTFLYITI